MINSIATFTISDDYMNREYQHINISLVYNYENNLDESTIALKLERFLKERHIDRKYTLMDDIIDILYTGGYEIKINDDYLRIAEETWRLHNRITKLEIDKHIVQKDLLNKTYNEKRALLGLDPIESCDTKRTWYFQSDKRDL